MDTVLKNELYHHGTKGQRWGYRRWQNYDGSLTDLGRLHYGVGKARNYVSKLGSSVSEAGSNIKKSYNDVKIDVLDYANRKGVLDFLDSKADAPFKAVRTSLNNRTDSEKARVDDFIKDFRSEAYGSVDTALRKINRYSTMVASMRKNEPFVKIEDTSKPWKDTFKDGMMGWNHTEELENFIRSRAVDRYTSFLNSDLNKGSTFLDLYSNINTSDIVDKYVRGERSEPLTIGGQTTVRVAAQDFPGVQRDPEIFRNFSDTTIAKTSMRKINQSEVDDIIRSTGAQYIQALSDEGHLVKMGWDKNMNIETVDGLKVNSVVYDNGGGVQGNLTRSSSDRISQQANEVRDFIAETGRLPTTVVNSSYARSNSADVNTNHFIYLYRNNLVDWALQHDDFLAHYGTKNMHWGNRRYQYEDGSLTPLGRIHYGVGAARKGVAKAASSTSSAAKKAGNAIRKKVKPTDEELLEKYNKAKSKQARRELKQEIRDMSSLNKAKASLKQKKAEKEERKKKYEKMSDQDVINMINRYRNEAALKALARDSKKSPLRLAIDDAARNAIARAAGATLQSALTNIGQNIADEFDTPANKLRREAQMIENKEKIDKAKKGPSILDEMQEVYDAAKRSRDTYETQLQEAALRGNEEAKQRLSDYKNAVKGSHKSARDDPSYVDLDQDVENTYESSKKTSKRQNENVSDVIRNGANKEYEEAVTDVDVEYVDDYIKTSSTKKFRLLPFRR